MAAAPGGAEDAPLSSAPARGRGRGAAGDPPRGTRAEALDVVFAFAEELGEGFRHGAVGLPRFGKTFHAEDVIREAQARGIVRWALVHDVKKTEPQYAGTVRENVQALFSKPLGPSDDPTVVFHPTEATSVRSTPEDVAQVGKQLGRAKQPTLVHVDELYHALSGDRAWAGPTLPHLFREGSSQRISVIYTTQIPQQLPTEAIDLVDSMAIFRLSVVRGLPYVVRKFNLPPRAEEIVPRLKRGEFILVTLDGWDGKIYGPS